jgi:hypothetical protein
MYDKLSAKLRASPDSLFLPCFTTMLAIWGYKKFWFENGWLHWLQNGQNNLIVFFRRFCTSFLNQNFNQDNGGRVYQLNMYVNNLWIKVKDSSFLVTYRKW